jgi:hypothetical protein
MAREKHDFLKNGSGIFLAEGLDRANQVEMVGENCGLQRRRSVVLLE